MQKHTIHTAYTKGSLAYQGIIYVVVVNIWITVRLICWTNFS